VNFSYRGISQSLEDGDNDFHFATKGEWQQHRHQPCRRKQGLVLGSTMIGMQSHMGKLFGNNDSFDASMIWHDIMELLQTCQCVLNFSQHHVHLLECINP